MEDGQTCLPRFPADQKIASACGKKAFCFLFCFCFLHPVAPATVLACC